MKRILKVLLVIIATAGLTGYARVPEGDLAASLQARTSTATARIEAPVLTRATTESPEPSELALLLCGFVVVGFIARRKSRLVAG